MARETKEQRQIRESREQLEREIEVAESRKTIPARLVMMQAVANQVGVSCTVSLTDTGPSVHFEHSEYQSDRERIVIDETLRYDSEQWEIESVESTLNQMKEEQDAKAARLKLAQDHFSTLSPELKAAIKEHSCWLR